MTMKEIIEFNGIDVLFHPYKNSKCNFKNNQYCAICDKKLEPSDSIYHILSNQLLFQNTWAHMRCVKRHGKYISISFIKHRWDIFVNVLKKNRSFEGRYEDVCNKCDGRLIYCYNC